MNEVLECLGMHEALSLVVIGTTRPDSAILHYRFKRLGLPKLNRVHRHHIHMSIYQHSGGILVDNLFSVGHRIAVGLYYLSLVGSRCQQ